MFYNETYAVFIYEKFEILIDYFRFDTPCIKKLMFKFLLSRGYPDDLE